MDRAARGKIGSIGKGTMCSRYSYRTWTVASLRGCTVGTVDGNLAEDWTGGKAETGVIAPPVVA
jgi:hypothetical protein